jgi:hypothetical protein
MVSREEPSYQSFTEYYGITEHYGVVLLLPSYGVYGVL